MKIQGQSSHRTALDAQRHPDLEAIALIQCGIPLQEMVKVEVECVCNDAVASVAVLSHVVLIAVLRSAARDASRRRRACCDLRLESVCSGHSHWCGVDGFGCFVLVAVAVAVALESGFD